MKTVVFGLNNRDLWKVKQYKKGFYWWDTRRFLDTRRKINLMKYVSHITDGIHNNILVPVHNKFDVSFIQTILTMLWKKVYKRFIFVSYIKPFFTKFPDPVTLSCEYYYGNLIVNLW